MGWFTRSKRPPEENPEVRAAMDARDQVLSDANDAIQEVDRVQNAIIAEYAAVDLARANQAKRDSRRK